MLLIWIAGEAGLPVIVGNPLPGDIQAYIKEHPYTILCGEAASVRETEGSETILIDHSYLIHHSLKYPAEKIQITIRQEIPENILPGSFLVVSGNLEEFPGARNPGEYDRRRYMACRHCYYQIRDAKVLQSGKSSRPVQAFLFRLKDRFASVLESSAGEDAAEFLAIALGDRTEFADETRMLYQMAGVFHVFVISGLHISVIGLGLYELLLRRLGLGIRLSGFFAGSVLLLYGMMTGGGISTIRAVSMFLLLILSRILGRIYDMLTALAFSGILLLVESPGYLYDPGFLLSFSAVTGTAVLYPCLMEIWNACVPAERSRRLISVRKSLMLSLSVQLMSLPVVLHSYGEVSLAGPVLNLLIIPTSGVLLISAAAAMMAGTLFLPAGILAAVPGRLMLKMYRLVSGLAGYLPVRAWIPGAPGTIQTILYLVLMMIPVCLGEYLKKCSRRQVVLTKRKKGTAGFCGMTAVILGLLTIGSHGFHGIRITALDIGQGSCVVAETRRHHGILLDAGSTNKENIGQYQLLPFLKNQGICELDAAFVSHTDQDHISGIVELLEYQEKRLGTIRLNSLILPDWENPPAAYIDLVDLAERAGVKVIRVSSGDGYRNGNTMFRVLSPEPGKIVQDANEDGMVVIMEYGKFSMLFPGDIGEDTEKELTGKLKDTDVLLAPHHGSAHSGCREFLEAVQPELAVISCSEKNRYGHPSPDTVKRIRDSGSEILFTMKSGAVRIRTDGDGSFWTATFLPETSGEEGAD